MHTDPITDQRSETQCHCGRPLHYGNQRLKEEIEELCAVLGSHVVVTVGRRAWRVQRHYIALHGLKAWEIHRLGFEEIIP